ncbi:hypothetical protein ZWY2020_026739 [Hordeum vulgare]|nr:hypothetical protein ZWY2020_026739 [Hordeum vulgare]
MLICIVSSFQNQVQFLDGGCQSSTLRNFLHCIAEDKEQGRWLEFFPHLLYLLNLAEANLASSDQGWRRVETAVFRV